MKKILQSIKTFLNFDFNVFDKKKSEIIEEELIEPGETELDYVPVENIKAKKKTNKNATVHKNGN